jgi:hypothetical protein
MGRGGGAFGACDLSDRVRRDETPSRIVLKKIRSQEGTNGNCKCEGVRSGSVDGGGGGELMSE